MTTQIREAAPQNAVISYPSRDLIQLFKSKLGSVKMLPDIAVKALEIAKDPEASIQSFSEVIQHDIKLTADVLSMANSVLYSSSEPTVDLARGITRLGFRQCKNLIIASSLASVMKQMTLEEQWIRDVLWKHSVTTGVIATHINRTLKTGFEGEEFTAGLIHDFGRTLLAVAFPAKFSSFDPLDFEESPQVLDREQGAIGSDHCELGAWFAFEQGLPEVLQEVIRFHHNPTASTRNPRLVALIATADHMANHSQKYGETEAYDPTNNPGLVAMEMSGIRDAANRFLAVAAEVRSKAIEDTNAMIAL